MTQRAGFAKMKCDSVTEAFNSLTLKTLNLSHFEEPGVRFPSKCDTRRSSIHQGLRAFVTLSHFVFGNQPLCVFFDPNQP